MKGIGKWKLFHKGNTPEAALEAEEGLKVLSQEKDFRDCKTYRLTLEETSVEFKVPFPFEKMEDEEETEWGPDDMERFAEATFTRKEECNMVNCYLHAPHAENYANAEEYVRYYVAECSDVKEKDRKIQQIILYEKLYYYYIVQYKCKFGKFQELCVAADVGDGKIYAVETEWVNEKRELTLDEVACFMDFRRVEI